MVFHMNPCLVPYYLIKIFVIFFVVDITSDIVNYAEDTTPYECDQHCDNMISNLEVAVIKFSVVLSIII